MCVSGKSCFHRLKNANKDLLQDFTQSDLSHLGLFWETKLTASLARRFLMQQLTFNNFNFDPTPSSPPLPLTASKKEDEGKQWKCTSFQCNNLVMYRIYTNAQTVSGVLTVRCSGYVHKAAGGEIPFRNKPSL